jgi:hypothetical protein
MAALMPSRRREQWLLVLFPAALILAVYSVFSVIPAHRQLQGKQSQVQIAQVNAVTAFDAGQSLANLEQARLSLQRLKSNIASNRESLQRISQEWRRIDNRLATFQQITEMMRYHDLSVVFQGYMDELELSTYNQELIDILNRQDPSSSLEYWQIEMQGSFMSVTQFLDSINSQQLGVIPVSVSMKVSPQDANEKSWTIVFLI